MYLHRAVCVPSAGMLFHQSGRRVPLTRWVAPVAPPPPPRRPTPGTQAVPAPRTGRGASVSTAQFAIHNPGKTVSYVCRGDFCRVHTMTGPFPMLAEGRSAAAHRQLPPDMCNGSSGKKLHHTLLSHYSLTYMYNFVNCSCIWKNRNNLNSCSFRSNNKKYGARTLYNKAFK